MRMLNKAEFDQAWTALNKGKHTDNSKEKLHE